MLGRLRPPPKLKPSAWAEKNVRIPAGNAVPGLLRLDNAPYQREPMDMAVNPDCYRITLMWGAQVGKTMLALCIQGYHIAAEPASQMMMQPSQDDLRTWLETKFNPMAEECAQINSVLAKPRGRDGVNNQKMKSYPGGFLMFAWAGSPKTMRGRSAPKIVCDEVDGYIRTVEGHPVGLLWQRSATFGDQRFLVEISTPTIKGASYIESAYEMGDQRHFFVCCPHCDDHVTIEWENVRWDGQRETHEETLASIDEQKPDTAHLYCPSCGCQWSEGERIAAIRQAESKGAGWKALRPFDGHASYHLNEFYSVFRTVPAIVRDYLDKLRTGDLQTFTNVSLARTWEEASEQVDPDSLMARREEYAAAAPLGVLYITAGIDMQIDRLEVEVVGWGIGEESWSLGYFVLWGDPLTPDPWNALDDLLAETWQHESGAVLPISAACLDTGGTKGYTQAAYDYAKGRTGRRLFAIKGIGGWGRAVVEKPQRKQTGRNKRKVDLFLVGTDETKLITSRRLGILSPGPGYCHFPADRDAEWFQQLTAEKLTLHYVKGFPVREWKKPDHARNEALDCRNYAYAALKIMAPSLNRVAKRLGIHVTGDVPDKRRRLPPAKALPAPEPEVTARPARVKRSSQIDNPIGKAVKGSRRMRR
ncbi:phage terminase large subunit family protein [Salmonella enterica subsp. salamae]|nr:phage terminase large subunit family protein [Salmonella enterica subsp. salamae]ECJ2281396.1 phage terminase large subunit family protein [Salmonella enterica subsp. salamae]